MHYTCIRPRVALFTTTGSRVVRYPVYEMFSGDEFDRRVEERHEGPGDDEQKTETLAAALAGEQTRPF